MKFFRFGQMAAQSTTDAGADDENAEIKARRKIEREILKARVYEKSAAAKKEIALQDIQRKIFPRTIESVERIGDDSRGGGNYAMDAGLANSDAAASKICLDREVLSRLQDYFIGWTSCAILVQRWLIDRACTIPGEDAIAPGWEVVYSESFDKNAALSEDVADQQKQAQRLKEIEQSAIEMGVAEVCKKAERIKKIFGYSLVVPDLNGVDMSKPFTADTPIPKGSYKGLSVIEPMWIIPVLGEGGMDPASRNFYNPEWYKIAGSNRQIHRSWVVKLINSPVPDILKPAYFFGGVPLTQQIYKRVYAAEKVADEAPMLAMTKRLTFMTGVVENAIANPEIWEERMRLLTDYRDNYSVALVNEGSDVRQLDTSLVDFDQLTMTQYQLVASVAQMPVTKLMKVQVKGFDSAGEYEKDDYNKSLVAIQTNDYTPIIELHNMMFEKSAYGEAIALSVRWNEVELPTPKENAEIRLIEAQRDATYVNAGIISADEARERLRNDENGDFTYLPDLEDEIDISDPDDNYSDTNPDETGDRLNNVGAEV